MKAYLYRTESGDEGTFGYFVLDDLWWFSLELPWRNNAPNISCIPAGSYRVERRYSPHFRRELYWVRHVKNRSFILIHPANFAGDESLGWQSHLQGCITLGKVKGEAVNKFGIMQKCVFRSREAVSELELALGSKPFDLIIEEV